MFLQKLSLDVDEWDQKKIWESIEEKYLELEMAGHSPASPEEEDTIKIPEGQLHHSLVK